MVEVMNIVMLTIDYIWYDGFNHHHIGLWKKSDQNMNRIFGSEIA